jgi:hypothetical protein
MFLIRLLRGWSTLSCFSVRPVRYLYYFLLRLSHAGGRAGARRVGAPVRISAVTSSSTAEAFKAVCRSLCQWASYVRAWLSAT